MFTLLVILRMAIRHLVKLPAVSLLKYMAKV